MPFPEKRDHLLAYPPERGQERSRRFIAKNCGKQKRGNFCSFFRRSQNYFRNTLLEWRRPLSHSCASSSPGPLCVPSPVVPAQTGPQVPWTSTFWIPACAAMTH